MIAVFEARICQLLIGSSEVSEVAKSFRRLTQWKVGLCQTMQERHPSKYSEEEEHSEVSPDSAFDHSLSLIWGHKLEEFPSLASGCQ
jgi:hypothetical protein